VGAGKTSQYVISQLSVVYQLWFAALSACLVKLVREFSMMLSCLLFHGLILCNFDSYFAYLFASLGLFMFVCLFVCFYSLACLLSCSLC